MALSTATEANLASGKGQSIHLIIGEYSGPLLRLRHTATL